MVLAKRGVPLDEQRAFLKAYRQLGEEALPTKDNMNRITKQAFFSRLDKALNMTNGKTKRIYMYMRNRYNYERRKLPNKRTYELYNECHEIFQQEDSSSIGTNFSEAISDMAVLSDLPGFENEASDEQADEFDKKKRKNAVSEQIESSNPEDENAESSTSSAVQNKRLRLFDENESHTVVLDRGDRTDTSSPPGLALSSSNVLITNGMLNQPGSLTINPSFNSNMSAIQVVLTQEQKLRSQLPVMIVEYANKLKVGGELKEFTQRVRDTIWSHFSEENLKFERSVSHRLTPRLELRTQQVKQAQGVLSQVFKQVNTPIQLSLFVRDYISVLKFSSVQNLNDRIRDLIYNHENRQKPNLIYRFCAIQ